LNKIRENNTRFDKKHTFCLPKIILAGNILFLWLQYLYKNQTMRKFIYLKDFCHKNIAKKLSHNLLPATFSCKKFGNSDRKNYISESAKKGAYGLQEAKNVIGMVVKHTNKLKQYHLFVVN